MLTSINPLGERARGQNFYITTLFYLVGSTAGGLFLGTIGGSIGSLLPEGSWRLVLAGFVAALGAVMDIRGYVPPSLHRQVDENWLDTYRGWVYGLGFGAQLGFGLATIVPSASVYSMVIMTVLSGSLVDGAIIGGVFGLVRALTILMVIGVKTPNALRQLMRRLQDQLRYARASVVGAQAILAIGALAVLI